MKTCTKCLREKPITEFVKQSSSKSGYSSHCKLCVSLHTRIKRANQSPEQRKKYNEQCKKYREGHKEKVLAAGKMYARINREQRIEYMKQYTKTNQEKIINKNKKYYENNKDLIKKKTAKYSKNKKATCVQFKLAALLRSRLRSAVRKYLQGKSKAGSAVLDLGCSIQELKLYLESKFQSGMSWGNWGPKGWHIDHIVPISKFDLSNLDQLKAACHYTNLQPLWAVDNLKKSNKVL